MTGEKILDILYPSRCPICSDILYEKNKLIKPDVCKSCEIKLPYIKEPICYKCGKPLENEETEKCYDCSKTEHKYERGIAAFTYSDDIKKSIYNFKYRNRRDNGKFYAKVIVEKYADLIKRWNIDALIPVPLHKSKTRIRGFNQAEIIANEISKLMGIKVDTDILFRLKKTKNWMIKKDL